MRDNRRISKAGIRPDCDDDKRFPNSISATVRAVAAWWLKTTDPDSHTSRTSVPDFCRDSEFRRYLDETLLRFKGVPRKHTDLKEMIDKTTRQNGTDFEYYRLRAFSDFMGISESAFLTIAKLVSIERRIDDDTEREEAITQYLDANIRLLKEARKIAKATGTNFSLTDNTEVESETWMANMSVVHRMVQAYKKGDLAAFEEAMKRK